MANKKPIVFRQEKGSFWTRNIPTKKEYYLKRIADNLVYIFYVLCAIAGILLGGTIAGR